MDQGTPLPAALARREDARREVQRCRVAARREHGEGEPPGWPPGPRGGLAHPADLIDLTRRREPIDDVRRRPSGPREREQLGNRRIDRWRAHRLARAPIVLGLALDLRERAGDPQIAQRPLGPGKLARGLDEVGELGVVTRANEQRAQSHQSFASRYGSERRAERPVVVGLVLGPRELLLQHRDRGVVPTHGEPPEHLEAKLARVLVETDLVEVEIER